MSMQLLSDGGLYYPKFEHDVLKGRRLRLFAINFSL